MKTLTTDQFIEKAKEIHGDKYDYSKVEYVNNKTKVCIICPEHGEFWQTPSSHLQGQGCKKCIHRKKLTTEQFIEQAKKVHGDKYDYSKVEYVDSHTKVCIICPEHGEFWQTAYHHLQNHGCPKCSGREKKTTKGFVEQAKQTHGDKYDYSKIEYINNKTKVCIICPIHGEFWQKPNDHLNGQGCPKCGFENNRLTKEEFIEEAKQIHGDKYDYSKVEYVNIKTKVCIICPEHGEFWQKPNHHIFRKQGCPQCAKGSAKQFIERAKQIHGDKYDYSKVEYVNNKTKICIICPKHGEFWQTPYAHLRGQNCPKCNESKGEIKIETFLKEHGITYEKQKRFRECRNKRPLPFDFYLPEQNLCIEFQGKQHFEPSKIFGGEEDFKYRQLNDTIKREWCAREENPNLIEIKYDDNIEEILKITV